MGGFLLRREHRLIAACILAALCGLGFFLAWSRDTRPSPAAIESGRPVVGGESDTDAFDVEVLFDGEKFTPSEITIQKGTRVRFINMSDVDVWPASAVHPTHSIYPENEAGNCLGSSFDSCRKLGRGEFFNFTFQYVGEWRYHDHVKAYKTGVIFVTE